MIKDATALLRRCLALFLLLPLCGPAQTIDHIGVETPGTVTNGVPINIVLTAIGADGQPATNAQVQVALSSFQAGPGVPVISEVYKNGGVMEVANPTTQPVDLSDWELQALSDYTYPGAAVPNARLRFPPGTVLAPQGVLTWTDRGVPPGAFPSFVSAKPFTSRNGFYLGRLYNAAGDTVDEVYMHTYVYAADNALWKGVGLGICPTNYSYARLGNANHFRSLDWTTNVPSLGSWNPQLQLPWAAPGTDRPAWPPTVQLINGIWSGEVTLSNLPPATTWLQADNGAGILGTSAPFQVASLPGLALQVPPGISAASEATAGLAGYITLLLPWPTSTNLVVSFSLSDSKDFLLPPQVLVPLGTNAVLVPVTNLDDTVADGEAIVTLTASAPGYAPAFATLRNADNESALLSIIVPASLAEDCGFGADACRVFLPEPAHHDVLVRLTADPPIEVPEQVIIPQGALSQTFRLRVGNDALVNPYPWLVQVRAVTANWPAAVGTITLHDDDDGTFLLNLPATIVEGTTAPGQIQVRTLHQQDTLFSLTSNNPRLQVPPQVILPAGSLTVDFELQVTNNFRPDPQIQVQVCAQTAGQTSVCHSVTVLDDEVDLQSLVLGPMPAAVLSGQPFSFSGLLGNGYGQAQLTNALGQLALLAAPSLATLNPDPNPLQFTNGTWTNQVVLQGQGLGLQLRMSAAGLQADSTRFDLLPGVATPYSLTDAAWDPVSGKFLVLELAQTNAPPRLSEVDPWTGLRGRSLDLRRPAQRIALSDDGSVAWLASVSNTLQRIDLASWQFDAEYPLQPGASQASALELMVLPGEQDQVVAVTSTNQLSWAAVLYVGGAALSNRATLPGGRLTSATLAAGRPAELFCGSYSYLSRLVVGAGGLTLDRSVAVSGATPSPSLRFDGTTLLRGNGDAFLPDTLAALPGYATQSSVVGVPCLDRNTALFVEQDRLTAYDMSNRQLLGSHALPGSAASPSRLLRWSQSGFATFSASSKLLTIFQTPLLTTNLPDLALTALAPASATVPPDGQPVDWTWNFGVTNRGSSPAPGVQLSLVPGGTFPLGTLAPGEGRSITWTNGSYSIGIATAQATVTSAVPDANPQDNVATVVTRVRKQEMPSASQLILGMTHLIVSPAGDKLYAAVATSAGDVQDGVAVIAPDTGTIEQMLPVGTNPQHLALTPDGAYLYVLLGTNRLVRWNLSSGSNDLALAFTNEAVLDFVPNAASARSLVVSTTARVAIFDDDQMRPGTFESSIDRRYLGFAGGQLWTAEPGYLRSFMISGTGLTAVTNIPFTLFSDYYHFASDGRHLFFSGAVVDTQTSQRLPENIGDNFCVDIPNNSLFSPISVYMNRYSLTDYHLLDEQWLAQAGASYGQDPVRWGDSGLAVRFGPQLLIIRSPIVPATNSTDLTLSIIPPVSPVPYQQMEWTVTLTNNSAQPALRTLLTVSWGQMQDQSFEGPYSYETYSTLFYDGGDMPAHSGVSFKIRGWTYGGSLNMSGTVQTSATDANPADNSASATVMVSPPSADLGIASISAPAHVNAGDEFNATFVFTNAGPGAADTTLIELVAAEGLQFLGVADNAYPTNELGPLLGPIGPGESKTAVLRYKALGPGFMPVSAYASGDVSDPQSGNDRAVAWVYAAPTQTNDVVTDMTFAGALMAWDPSRQQMLAAFPNTSWSLFVLDPAWLEPVREVPLPGLPEAIAPCNNGRQAWVSLAGGAAVRVDLSTGALDENFRYDPQQTSVYGVASPPGLSNLLVAAIDPGFLGNNHLQVFSNGVALPLGYGPLGWAGGGEPLVFAPDGRLFLACSQILRQLQITPTGLAETRNLDSAALYSGLALTYARNRLFFSEGRVLDLATGTANDTLLDSASPLAADDLTGVAYTASGSRLLWGGQPMIIRRFNAVTLETQWRDVLYPPSSEATGIIPMGTNGCALFGDKLRLLRSAAMGTPSADLAVAFGPAPLATDVTVPFLLQVTVTNQSLWTAQNAALEVDLPPGLVFAATTLTTTNVALGLFNGATNLSFAVEPITNGAFTILASVTNDLLDPVETDNQQQLVVNVAPAPVFLFDDTAVLEGSSSRSGQLVGWLSKPPLTTVSVSFTITPITAQTNDFWNLSGVFQFNAGQTSAVSSVAIHGDSVPELDETAWLTFSSTNLGLARPTALLTILNDDFPQVSVGNISLLEGNAGYTNANFQVTLSTAAPFPVDVQFQVLPGSATPQVDYLSRQGWLHFAPGETAKTVAVPVLGDLDYEANETAYLVLQQAVNAQFAAGQGQLTIVNDDLPPVPQLLIQSFAGATQVRFNSVAGASYQLQSRTNWTTDPWHTLSGTFQGTGHELFIPITASPTRADFYRVLAR